MKLKIEQHDSPDRGIVYYYIMVDNFAVYSTGYLEDAIKRFDHIKEVGIAAYLEEIKIIKTLIKEEDIESPEQNNIIDVQ